MADVLKLYGRDQSKVDEGVAFFIDSGDDDYILLRHTASKAVRDYVQSLPPKERRLFDGERVSGTKSREVLAKVFANVIICGWGDSVTWDGKKSIEKHELEKFLSQEILEGLIIKMLAFASDDRNYGLDEFEEDSKNFAMPSDLV